MDDKEFSAALLQAAEERKSWYDTSELPKLRDDYKGFQDSVSRILNIFLKKKLIDEDPYKHEKKISDIQIPSDEIYAENDRTVVIGTRLSDYELSLDFLYSYYKFSVDGLPLERIKRLIALNNSFNWNNVSVTSDKPNTRGLAEILQSVLQGNDALSVSMINDSLSRIRKSLESITEILKRLTDFQKECYKIEIRNKVLSVPAFDRAKAAESPAAAMQQIRKILPTAMGKKSFYPELIEELIQEEFGVNKDALRTKLIEKIAVSDGKKEEKEQQIDLKELLLDGVRTIASTAPQYEQILPKLEENKNVINSQHNGFMHRLKMLLRKAFNIEEKELEYTIMVTDPITQLQKNKSVNYSELVSGLTKRVRVYNAVSIKKSQGYQKLEAQTEAYVLDFLIKQQSENQGLLTTLNALDDFFKTSALPGNRSRIKGLKVELGAIKSALVKANQYRAEYLSTKEEQEQLARMGLK
ncbi:MAG: hypothetical protein LBU99_03740 [Spirochaetaceae bacterium]|jgi:hypothetical protein|nr:hypothetical protein [Spirochaetaceae bacterium]